MKKLITISVILFVHTLIYAQVPQCYVGKVQLEAGKYIGEEKVVEIITNQNNWTRTIERQSDGSYSMEYLIKIDDEQILTEIDNIQLIEQDENGKQTISREGYIIITAPADLGNGIVLHDFYHMYLSDESYIQEDSLFLDYILF